MARKLRYLQALNEAIVQEMDQEPRSFMIGEDIRENLRGETRGLFARFGESRVLDAPISEAAMAGLAIGAAFDGMRAIVELQIPSLVYTAFDQIVNQAAKLPLMMGGQATLPITYLVMASGHRPGLAGQHSDSPYSLLAHCGVKVVCPSNAFDAKGLAAAAFQTDDPVAIVAPAALLGVKSDVPEDNYQIELGVGRVAREGADITVVATGYLVGEALSIAADVEADGIDVEVWDPRTIFPLDREGLVESIRKTGRLVVVDDANPFCGFSAEVAAVAGEVADLLQSPVIRVTRSGVPIPFSRPLEDAALPSVGALRAAIFKSMRRE